MVKAGMTKGISEAFAEMNAGFASGKFSRTAIA